MSAIVRVDTLKAGDKFTPAYGGHFVYVRETSVGCHMVTKEDGFTTYFAGCADVERGHSEEGWGWKERDRSQEGAVL